MTTQESIKPLVDRILSNPLQFNAAMISNKSNNNDTSAAPENSSYIVIGKQHNNNSNSTAIAATAESKQIKENNLIDRPNGKKTNTVPKSMAEALLLYTSKNDKDAADTTGAKKSARNSN